MKIGIIGAMDCEIEQFCKDFCAHPSENEGIFEGKFAQHDIYICCCGIGKVNAAANTQKLCDLYDVDYIINSGVAGSVSKSLGICDIAISKNLTYHDFHPLELLDKYVPNTSVFSADERLVKYACNACEKLASTNDGFKYQTGTIVSGDIFVEDSKYVKQLGDKFDALCTEMEGAAVAHVCVLNKKPFVVIRAISDNADENADISFEKMVQIAANRASFVAKEIISQSI